MSDVLAALLDAIVPAVLHHAAADRVQRQTESDKYREGKARTPVKDETAWLAPLLSPLPCPQTEQAERRAAKATRRRRTSGTAYGEQQPQVKGKGKVKVKVRASVRMIAVARKAKTPKSTENCAAGVVLLLA